MGFAVRREYRYDSSYVHQPSNIGQIQSHGLLESVGSVASQTEGIQCKYKLSTCVTIDRLGPVLLSGSNGDNSTDKDVTWICSNHHIYMIPLIPYKQR